MKKLLSILKQQQTINELKRASAAFQLHTENGLDTMLIIPFTEDTPDELKELALQAKPILDKYLSDKADELAKQKDALRN